MDMPARAIRIGVLGDFNFEYRSHHATNSSLQQAAKALGRAVEFDWVPTPSLEGQAEGALSGYDALWASPGSPYRSMNGMLAGIEFARLHGKPFVAT
jgi:CTP synthase (UTP-ammonia lyase)